MSVNTLEGYEGEDDKDVNPAATECNNKLGTLQDENCHNLELLKKAVDLSLCCDIDEDELGSEKKIAKEIEGNIKSTKTNVTFVVDGTARQDSAPTSDAAKNALKKLPQIKNIREASLIAADAIALFGF